MIVEIQVTDAFTDIEDTVLPHMAKPIPATHAISTLLKAGECIRHSI